MLKQALKSHLGWAPVTLATILLSTLGVFPQESVGYPVTLNVPSGEVTYSGVIADNSGQPISIVKEGSGTLTITNINTYTGGTVVREGAVVLTDAGVLKSKVAVNAGASFSGGGVVQGDFSNLGGILVTSTGTPLNVMGNYTDTDRAVATIRVDADFRTPLQVAGTAEMKGTVNVEFADGDYQEGEFLIVSADIMRGADAVTINNTPLGFTVSPVVREKGLFLSLFKSSPASSDTAPLSEPLVQPQIAEVTALFQQKVSDATEASTHLTQVSQLTARVATAPAASRLHDSVSSSSSGGAGGGSAAGGSAAGGGKGGSEEEGGEGGGMEETPFAFSATDVRALFQGMPGTNKIAAIAGMMHGYTRRPRQGNVFAAGNNDPEKQGLDLWGKLIGSWGRQRFRKGTDGFRSVNSGIGVGVDKATSEHTKMGTSVTYSYTLVKPNNDPLSSTDVDSYVANVYGLYHPERTWFVDAILGIGQHRHKNVRDTGKTGIARVKFATTQYTAEGTVGHVFRVDRTTVIPSFKMHASLLRQPRHRETGSGDNQSIGAVKSKLFQTTTSMKASRTFFLDNGFRVQPYVGGGWGYDFNPKPAPMSIAGGVGNFVVQGPKQARTSGESSCGVQFKGQGFDFEVDYSSQFKSKFRSHNLLMKATYKY